jgi:hypothetical protein
LARNKWLNEKDYRTDKITYLEDHYNKKYKVGFHVYIEYPDSYYIPFEEKIVKVYFKKYRCIGEQGVVFPKITIVTPEIFIPREK